MALISDLVVELSMMSGIPKPSITVVARHLREAGLLSQKGRGRGAARATPLDAARLCIALMLGRKAKDAPSVVKDFGQLQCCRAEVEPDHMNGDLNLEAVFGLKVGHSFEQGFAGLIAVWADTALVDEMEKRKGPQGFWPIMFAALSDGTLTGEIQFAVAHYDYRHAAQLQLGRLYQYHEDPLEGAEERYELSDHYQAFSDKYYSGIRSTREICGVEIMPLGEVVADLRPAGYRESQEETTKRAVDANRKEDAAKREASRTRGS